MVSSGSGLLLMYPIFMTSDVTVTNIFDISKLFSEITYIQFITKLIH